MLEVGSIYEAKVFDRDIEYLVIITERRGEDVIVDACHSDSRISIQYPQETFLNTYKFKSEPIGICLFVAPNAVHKNRLFYELKNGKLVRVANEFWPAYNSAKL
jgi:hypothetical protein